MSERLDLEPIKERLQKATEGEWAKWLDQDNRPHMHGRLMVGSASGVIPDGETYVEGNVNPIAECYTSDDREFIAHSRTDIPALIAEVERLRERQESLERRLPCDGGCSWVTGPQEECSLHGCTPAELWESIYDLVRQRDKLAVQIDRVREIAESSVGGFVADRLLKMLEGRDDSK